MHLAYHDICNLHIKAMDRWLTVLNNATFYRMLRPKFDIIVLDNGVAVHFTTPDQMLVDLRVKLLHQQVHFDVCRNALIAHEIDEASLLSDVGVVPSGVVELADKQAEGFAYIKA